MHIGHLICTRIPTSKFEQQYFPIVTDKWTNINFRVASTLKFDHQIVFFKVEDDKNPFTDYDVIR